MKTRNMWFGTSLENQCIGVYFWYNKSESSKKQYNYNCSGFRKPPCISGKVHSEIHSNATRLGTSILFLQGQVSTHSCDLLPSGSTTAKGFEQCQGETNNFVKYVLNNQGSNTTQLLWPPPELCWIINILAILQYLLIPKVYSTAKTNKNPAQINMLGKLSLGLNILLD